MGPLAVRGLDRQGLRIQAEGELGLQKGGAVAEAIATLADAEEDQHFEEHVRHSNPVRR